METPPFRRQSPIPISRCTLAASFEFLGDRWSLLIVRSALFGVRRFDDFQTELAIPRTVLADRLKRLVASGIMTRQDYKATGSRPRKEYLLTEMGESLRLPFLAMRQWSERWVSEGRPPPMTLVRKSNGAEIRVAFIDEAGQVVPPDDLMARFENSPPGSDKASLE